jgi:ATP-binding cassette subfamily B protein
MVEYENALKNKPIPETIRKLVEAKLVDDERLLFVIIGDLTLEGKYGESALAVTDKKVMSVDSSHADGILTYEYKEIKDASIKRMYGNAQLNIELNDGRILRFFRFTYTVTTLCEMASSFIVQIGKGSPLKDELEIAEATFEKLMSVCPTCGRTLIRPGADCIKCQSKKKIATKFIKYIIPEKWPLLFSLFLSVITTAIALLPPYITKELLNSILPNKDYRALTIVVIVLLVSYIVHYSVAAYRGYLLRMSGNRIVESLRNDVYQKAQYLPMKFYDKTTTGSVINRINGDTENIRGFIIRVTQEILVQFMLLIGIVVIMLTMHWKLTLLSLIPVPFVVIGAKVFAEKIRPYYIRIWRRGAAVSSVLTDTIPNIKVVKSFAKEQSAVKKFERYTAEWRKVDTNSAKITNTFPNAVALFVTLGSLLIWSIGGKWVISGSLSVGLLVSFISYTAMFYGPVGFFANFSDVYQSALTSIERILDIIDAEPEPDYGKGRVLGEVKGKIEFRNVNFSFDRTKKVLSDINLVIEPGDVVGIVGTTGSGKSTLVNLIMRFYSDYEGDILLDGVNIKDIDMEFYRSCIGFVQQDPMMFSDTIFNNIAYGVPDAHVEQVIHAADIANAHDFIAKQPDGYDSVLGERGVGLSGGERQRISIARAVLKNPRILIFDEATASVDSETENLIQQAIDRMISGRTTLMIAHRLSTLRKANKIVVVDQGRIIECGSHEELMALKGKYHKLIEIQSLSEKLQRDKEKEKFE